MLYTYHDRDRHGNTPFMNACRNNDIYKARKMILHSNYAFGTILIINPGHVNNEGKTALIYACENHNNDLALLVLRTNLSNPDHETPDGRTALSIAQESQEMQEFIIEIIRGDYVEIKELHNFEFRDAELFRNTTGIQRPAGTQGAVALKNLSVEHCGFTNFKLRIELVKNFTFSDTRFQNSNIKNSVFERGSFTDVEFENTLIVKCSFDEVTFRNTVLSNVNFVNPRFYGIRFENTIFNDVVFHYNFELEDEVDPLFENATFINCTVEGDQGNIGDFVLTQEQRNGLGIFGPAQRPPPRGIAFEVHNEFDSIRNRLQGLYEIIKTKQQSVVPLKIIQSFFIKFIKSNFPEQERTTAIEQLKEVLNKYRLSSYSQQPDIRKNVSIVYRFVKEQPKEFIDFYIRAFIQDCYFAYPDAEPGLGISCVAGIIEKFVLILKQTAIALCPGNDCENETYKKINNFFNNKIDKEMLNKFAEEWGNEYLLPENENKSPEDRKESFRSFVINKLTENGLNFENLDEESKTVFRDYLTEIDYVFETGYFGGCNKNKMKKSIRKTQKKNKHNTNHQTRTKKGVTKRKPITTAIKKSKTRKIKKQNKNIK